MNKQAPVLPVESRWPVILTVLTVMGLVALLPDRISLLPDWVPVVLGVVVIIPMLFVSLSRAKARWLRIEFVILLVFSLTAGIGNLVSLTYLIDEIVDPSRKLDGLQLFTSSIAVWTTNVLTFSLLYWQIDRHRTPSDWLFPQADLPEDVMPNWRPTFIDYLFLAFTTATAFSPTDALPLTSRAKILMMLESSIALMTVAVVAARAINILGS